MAAFLQHKKRNRATAAHGIAGSVAGLLTGLILIAASWLLATPKLDAAELTYDLALRYPHVWRGISLRDYPVLSTSVTIRHGNGFGVGFWAGLDLSDERDRAGEVQEINIDLFYRRELRWMQLETGYVELIFPGGIDNTGEAYLHLTSTGWLSPRLEIRYNVDLLRDFFLLFHLQESWQISDKAQASLKGTLAYSGEQFARFFGASQAGWHHWEATGDLDFAFERGSVKLRLAYTDNLEQDVLGDQPVNLWGGLYFSVTR